MARVWILFGNRVYFENRNKESKVMRILEFYLVSQQAKLMVMMQRSVPNHKQDSTQINIQPSPKTSKTKAD